MAMTKILEDIKSALKIARDAGKSYAKARAKVYDAQPKNNVSNADIKTGQFAIPKSWRKLNWSKKTNEETKPDSSAPYRSQLVHNITHKTVRQWDNKKRKFHSIVKKEKTK
jgi:hypothetical protein